MKVNRESVPGQIVTALSRRDAAHDPFPDTLPKRPPGVALAELEADQWRGRAEVAERELETVTEDLMRTTWDLEATVAECDDLSTRVLPSLPGAVYAETTEPVGALIADQIAAETGFKGWWS